MGNQIVTDEQAGFAGGLNATSDPVFLGPDQARVMENLRLSQYGAALKRLGTHIAGTPTIITTFPATASLPGYAGVGAGWWPGAGYYMFLGPATNSSTQQLYVLNIGYPFPNAKTWTMVGACPQYYPVIFSDGTTETVYFGGNSLQPLYKWQGGLPIAPVATTATGLAGGLTVYNDRLWSWATPINGAINNNILYFSNLSSVVGSIGGDSLGNASSATVGGGQIRINTFGESQIVAARPCNGALLIFHWKGISVLTGWGQADISVEPQVLNSTIGMAGATLFGICSGNDLSTGDIVYFVTPLGIYATNGGWVKPLGTPQRPDPTAALLRSQSVEPSAFTLAFNKQFNEVWVGIQGVGVYIYNIILQAWAGPFTGTYANGLQVLFEVEDNRAGTGLGQNHIWKIDLNGNFGSGYSISECDHSGSALDDTTYGGSGGTPITASLQLRRMTSQDRVFAKSWRWLNLLATLQSGDVPPIVTYTTQYGGTNSYTMTNLTSAEKAYYIPVGGEGSYIDATISDPGTAGAATNIYTLATVQGNKLGQR